LPRSASSVGSFVRRSATSNSGFTHKMRVAMRGRQR
jgi:hypothetical protein